MPGKRISKKKRIKIDNRILEKIFEAARSEESVPEAVPDGRWRAEVMCEVRRIGPLSGRFRTAVPLTQLAWRLAPVALVLIAILSVVVFQTGSTIDHQLVGMAVTDPVDAYVLYIPF